MLDLADHSEAVFLGEVGPILFCIAVFSTVHKSSFDMIVLLTE